MTLFVVGTVIFEVCALLWLGSLARRISKLEEK